MEDAPICAVCSEPIVNEDPHSSHEPDCPVVAASVEPDNTVALDDAVAGCTCPPDALCHPGCCQVCAAVDLALRP